MFKTIIASVLLLLPNIIVAQTFNLEEEAFTIGTDLKVSNGGIVEERCLSWTHTYEYFDSTHTKVATYTKHAFTWGTKYSLEDAKGNAVMVFDKDVLESFFVWGSSYDVLDKNGKVIAQVRSSRRPATFTIVENNGSITIATRKLKPFGIGYDKWEVVRSPSSTLPEYAIFFLCASKSAHDNRK